MFETIQLYANFLLGYLISYKCMQKDVSVSTTAALQVVIPKFVQNCMLHPCYSIFSKCFISISDAAER